MKFLPYEDVPLYLGVNGQEGEYIFAESVNLEVNQPLEVSRQVDDNLFQICNFGFGNHMLFIPPTFASNQKHIVTLGPVGGPPRPLATSIHHIPADTKITFPNNKHLYFANDIYPGQDEYLVEVYSTSGSWSLSEEEAERGYFEPIYKYHSTGPVQGKMDVSFYINTGNLPNFFNITGLSDPTAFPPLDNEKITGHFGDFTFSDAYLQGLSFSLSPNSISQASASFLLFGTLTKDENISDSYYSSDLYQQQSIPHGQNSQIIGHTNLGLNHPIGFSYSIQTSRPLSYLCPTGSNHDVGKIPDRVSKSSTTITMSLEGDNLDPDILLDGLGGKRANLKAQLSDLNYNNFDDNSNGFIHEFNCNGVVQSQSLGVNSAGYLNGSISVKQEYS
tara:strand:- start:707 stop:1873 length:1167 start_codon:yes stop_codon:yes gene_type:complete